MAGKRWRFLPESAIFFPVNNFPAMTLCTLFLICSINVLNYLFEQNNTNCATEGSIFEKIKPLQKLRIK